MSVAIESDFVGMPSYSFYTYPAEVRSNDTFHSAFTRIRLSDVVFVITRLYNIIIIHDIVDENSPTNMRLSSLIISHGITSYARAETM